jgi:hypothetical protein
MSEIKEPPFEIINGRKVYRNIECRVDSEFRPVVPSSPRSGSEREGAGDEPAPWTGAMEEDKDERSLSSSSPGDEEAA